MRIKLDENLSGRTAVLLRGLGLDVDTVLDEGIGGANDAKVWAEAQREQRLLVTQDLDFSDLRKFMPGTHHVIVLVRLPDAEQWRAHEHILRWFTDPDARHWGGCIVVASLTKVRVRRPPAP